MRGEVKGMGCRRIGSDLDVFLGVGTKGVDV